MPVGRGGQSGQNQGQCQDQRRQGRRYSISDLTNTLNISRTTLLYYEQLGILDPERTGDSRWRSYTDADIFRLMSCIMLKNIGVPPRDLADRLEEGPFTDEHFDEYLAWADRRVAYCQAQRVCLGRLNDLRHAVGTMSVVDVEPYYISYDRAEGGYHDFPEDEALVSLLANMPIGGLGSCYGGDMFEGDGTNRWGRTVAVEFAHLVEGLVPDGLTIIGGCRCLRLVYFNPDLFGPWDDAAGSARAAMRTYLEGHGLEAAGKAFAPYSLPSDKGFYVPLCLPVRGR